MISSGIEETDTRSQSQGLLRIAVAAGMLIPAVTSIIAISPVPIEVRLEAALLCAFCLVPSWSYLAVSASRRPPIPFVPIIGLLYALYFALPAALGSYNQHYKIVLVPTRDYDDAVFVALVGWLALLLGLAIGRLLLPSRRVHGHSPVPDGKLRNYGALLMLIGLGVDALRRLMPIPIEIAGLLVFASSLGWFGSGVLVMLNVRGRLKSTWQFLTYVGVTAFFLLAIGSGSVAAAAFYGTIIVVAAWIGRGRLSVVWIVGVVLSGVLIVSLRGVSDQYRKMVWFQGQGGGLLERPRLFFRLLQERVATDGIDGAITKGFETTAGRSANLDLLADVVRRTPDEIPYWGGTTYLSLVGAFVPRFLWPDKPTKELGQAFGHRYGYVGADDSNTAINLPILVEFYLNFGLLGVALGMTLVGVIYRVVENAVNTPGQDSILSLAGIVLMIPLTNIESDFSLGFGGLILNGLALWLVLRIMGRKIKSSETIVKAGHRHAAQLAIQRLES